MLTLEKLNNLALPTLCTLGEKKTNYVEEIAEHLLDPEKSIIRFEKFKCYIKLDSYYAELADNDLLCAAVLIHISADQRYLVDESIIKKVIKRIKFNANLQIDLDASASKYSNLINFSNGVYDVETQKLLPHSIKYGFDYELVAEYIPPEERKLDDFNYFVETSIGAENKTSILYTIGIAMSSIRNTKKMVMILGSGNSGKSLICDIVEKGVGTEYITTVPLDRLGKRESIAKYDMGRKRVNISRDTTIGIIKEDAGWKSVISCEPIDGHIYHKNDVTVRPRVFCIAASNEFPKFRNADDATLDRIVVIRIKGYEGTPDPTFSDKLLSETNSVVSLAVDQLKEFVKSYDFEVSEDSKSVLDQEKLKLHPIETFLEDCCNIYVNDANQSVPSALLVKKYCEWCDQNAIERLGKTKFFDKIRDLARPARYDKISYKGKSLWGFKHLGLKPTDGAESDIDDASIDNSSGTDTIESTEE